MWKNYTRNLDLLITSIERTNFIFEKSLHVLNFTAEQ